MSQFPVVVSVAVVHTSQFVSQSAKQARQALPPKLSQTEARTECKDGALKSAPDISVHKSMRVVLFAIHCTLIELFRGETRHGSTTHSL